MTHNSTQKTAEVRKTWDWHVRRRCEDSRQLEQTGDFEAARAALAGCWSVIGERPNVEKLPKDTQAELLMQVGSVSRQIGSAGQISGAQEFAKDLLAESERLFKDLGDQDKVSEAQRNLGLCYWREGALDEGRVLFRNAVSNAVSSKNRLRALIDSTTVEISSGHYLEALSLLDQAKPLLEEAEDFYKGSYHIQLALTHKKMSAFDNALIEYSAASLYLNEAGNNRYLAIVENNIGTVLLKLQRYSESLVHLDRARDLFVALKDTGHAAQVNDARAQAFIGQGKYLEAERAAFAAVNALERSDEQSLLAEALVTLGIALARLGKTPSARDAFEHAAKITAVCGDLNASGNAYLVMIEELRTFLAPSEAVQLLLEADERLGDNIRSESIVRLRSCMRIALDSLNKNEAGIDATLIGGTLEEELFHFEAQLIKRALDQADGSVTRAARLLGMTHQGLAWSLSHRHKQLLRWRKPSRRRHESIIKPVKQ
jgi:tetratricopeptide (TPR) repeat protein